jgi:hypothetical protein
MKKALARVILNSASHLEGARAKRRATEGSLSIARLVNCLGGQRSFGCRALRADALISGFKQPIPLPLLVTPLRTSPNNPQIRVKSRERHSRNSRGTFFWGLPLGYGYPKVAFKNINHGAVTVRVAFRPAPCCFPSNPRPNLFRLSRPMVWNGRTIPGDLIHEAPKLH